MNIIIGVTLLAMGFLISNWASKYSGYKIMFAPSILRSKLFNYLLLITMFGLLGFGIFFVFRGSMVIGLILSGIFIYGYIKNRRENSDKSIARWVFTAYKEYRNLFPKEKDKKIFERIFKKHFQDKDWMTDKSMQERLEKIEDLKGLASAIILWRKPHDIDMGNFEKWMEQTKKRNEAIDEVYQEIIEGKKKGKRYAPIITGVIGVGLGIFLISLGSLFFSILGFLLLMVGLRSLKTGIWGSQKLIDEITFKKYEDISEESKEEMESHKIL